jgi:hypothetical protein
MSSRIVEVLVTPDGLTTVQTKGYAGAECLHASRWLEQALGAVIYDEKTPDFYAVGDAEQHLRQA